MARNMAAVSCCHPRVGNSTTRSALTVTESGAGAGTTAIVIHPSSTIANAMAAVHNSDRLVTVGQSRTMANAASAARQTIVMLANSAGTRALAKPGNSMTHEYIG